MTGATSAAFVAEVRAFAESRRERLVALCGDLVASRSALPEGDTRRAAAAVAAFLREEGLDPESRAANPARPNVVCRTGSGGRQLVLNGHLDTLPESAGWTAPFYEMQRSDGRLTGLGIGNMKAGTAALAVAFAWLAKRAELQDGRVTFTAVADEVSFGPDGAAWLLDTDASLHGDALINAEGPGGMAVALAEKGLLWADIVAKAEPGQGMLATRRSGAIARLAGALGEIDAWNDEQIVPPDAIRELAAHAGPHGLRLSANIGRIEGGGLVSQIATEARAGIDFRLPPGLALDDLERRLDRLADGHGVAWQRIKGWEANWTPAASPIVAAVSAAADAVRGSATPVVRLPASDASRWRRLGIPAVCFGPQPTPASGVDDYVNEQDAVDCVAIYSLAALAFLKGAP